jgi:glucose/arabinose dehydrogenase/intracellular septation protein A
MPVTIQIPVLAKNRRAINRILVFIPLALAAFTHLWNPIGYPTFFSEESGQNLLRAMHFLETGNPKDDSTRYDQPYFGWMFLAGALASFGYPDSLNPSSDIHSIQTLYFFPRILMGLLAIADTFLVYKITQARYNSRVALIASILFAVMPLNLVTRRILLESIQLPFLLLSILFGLYSKYIETDIQNRTKRTVVFPLLSGICLGLAIFTKVPVITMIPLVGFIIYSNTRRNIWIQDRSMMVWLIPLILIPLIWPAHALLIGEYDEWKAATLYQLDGGDQSLSFSLLNLLSVDPVLLVLGVAGLVYSCIRKDLVPLMWFIPFIAFLQITGNVSFFNLIPLLPLFCITGSRLTVDLLDRWTKRSIKKFAPIIFVVAVGAFGLTSTTMLITQNLTESFFELYSFIAGAIPDDSHYSANNNATTMTVIGNNQYFWIPKYVLNKGHTHYESYYSWRPIDTRNYLLVVDRQFEQLTSGHNTDWRKVRLERLYDESHRVALFQEQAIFSRTGYPYSGMVQVGGIGEVEIRSNNYSTPIMLINSGYMLDPVFYGINFPSSMAFLGPDDILVLEKDEGTVRRIVNGTMLPEPVLDVDVANLVERGMVGIAVAKDHNYVFLYYTESDSDGKDARQGAAPLGDRLYRYEFVNGKLTNPKLLLDIDASRGASHNGGKLLIGPDNYIYLVVGDMAGHKTLTQNYKNSSEITESSVIFRITQDGQSAGPILSRAEPANKYYAYGIRNSYGMDFDPVTGKLWDTENGPNYGDEINLVEPGFNSGWKKVQGVWRLSDQGRPGETVPNPTDLVTFNGTGRYSPPEYIWNDSVGLTALKFLNSDIYGKEYQNDLFIADFGHGNVYHFDMNQNRTKLLTINGSSIEDSMVGEDNDLEESVFTRAPGGITDMEVGPDGYLYIVSLVGDVGGVDCTPDRKENCVDYDEDSSIANGGIFKVVPVKNGAAH